MPLRASSTHCNVKYWPHDERTDAFCRRFRSHSRYRLTGTCATAAIRYRGTENFLGRINARPSTPRDFGAAANAPPHHGTRLPDSVTTVAMKQLMVTCQDCGGRVRRAVGSSREFG